jgi:hypothetical protein
MAFRFVVQSAGPVERYATKKKAAAATMPHEFTRLR